MLPTQLLVSTQDERYYNRGKDEQTLDQEARAAIRADIGATPDKDVELPPGVNSLYDMYRRPLEIVEGRIVTLDAKTLNQDFTCPICLGILKDTMTTMDCMHRFCSECIVTCLRLSNKECPTCRARCQSKRNLRPDPAFDALLRAIYPNVDEVERREQELVSKINRAFDRETMRKTVEDGLKRQRESNTVANDDNSDNDNNNNNNNDDDDDDDDYDRGRHMDAPGEEDGGDFRAGRARQAARGGGRKKRAPAPRALRPPAAPQVAAAATPSTPYPHNPHRVDILLQRNAEERNLRELALPALVVPREATIAALAKLVHEYATYEDVPMRLEDIVFSMHGRHKNQGPVVLLPTDTIEDLLRVFLGPRLVIDFQTSQLAASLGFRMRDARATPMVAK